MGRVLFLFGLLGPPVGAIAHWWFGLQFAEASAGSHDVLFPMLGGLFLGVWDTPVAFAIGTVPAVTTGIAYWLTLKYKTQTNPAPLTRALAGALLGTPVAAVYGLAIGEAPILYKFIVPGAIAGATCAMLVTDLWYSKIFSLRVDSGHLRTAGNGT